MPSPKTLPPIALTWYGHSAFRLADDAGRSVLIDPWLDNPKSPISPADVPRPDLILVTHGHADHIGDAAALARRFDVPIVAIHELALHFQANGVAKATGMNKGGTLTIGGVSVTMTHAVHSGDIDAPGKGAVAPGGEPAGFVVGMPGHPNVYHAGDTDVFGDMQIIRDLHRPAIALLPIGGVYTMGPREAALAAAYLDAEVVVGMHYGTFPVLHGTPSALAALLPETRRGSVRELVPGVPTSLP